MNSTPTTPSETHHHHHNWPNTITNFFNQQEEQQQQQEESKEHMFEKPLTPSDVGKLNRLVIPKQHAEKYFPLGGVDSATEKGFLLSFEDESGKPWRFRYSYWTSSQSYVLTKGWSRFVKENRLDAGDIVTFERLRFDSDKFFIRCRRRSSSSSPAPRVPHSPSPAGDVDGTPLWAHALYHTQSHHHHHPYYSAYQPDHCYVVDSGGGVGGAANAIGTTGNSKRVRLFGVNLDCEMEEEEEEGPQEGPECSGLPGQQGPARLIISQAHGPTHYTHMELMMSQGVGPEREKLTR